MFLFQVVSLGLPFKFFIFKEFPTAEIILLDLSLSVQ